MMLGNNWFGRTMQRLFGPKRLDLKAAAWALREARKRHPDCWGAALSSAAGRILRERFADAHPGAVAALVDQAREQQ